MLLLLRHNLRVRVLPQTPRFWGGTAKSREFHKCGAGQLRVLPTILRCAPTTQKSPHESPEEHHDFGVTRFSSGTSCLFDFLGIYRPRIGWGVGVQDDRKTARFLISYEFTSHRKIVAAAE